MNDTLYTFEEAISKQFFTSEVILVSRRNGKIVDYILDGEVITQNDRISYEHIDNIMKEIKNY
ncbi:TPA: hypothetical protein ACG5TP_001688 [Streptococcus agalactiae]|uniref:Paratox n=1 Tax=Streptococcus agalactiae TaxID=1311 RepID=A0A853P843_STRAG|nr:hypothetical protein [Streptococcus agalactiae]AIF87507.1 hypothetical protein EN72_10530 [Streptococcus agalactiae]EMA8747117.1 hypothetical protein [Streptococcus agalactiae]EMC0661535.1 hypothetical protein [Streptococcus agalactiae]EPV45709.1 hypothetical protein SAG0353_10555 [Streptococcus agalactiae GB00901]KXA50060.1 hypothetical protein HMPREF1881_01446 [Streptococcus agalactiae]